MPKQDFSYYEKQLRECADLEGLKTIAEGQWHGEDAKAMIYMLDLYIQDAKQKRIELLNGLLQSIGKTPF